MAGRDETGTQPGEARGAKTRQQAEMDAMMAAAQPGESHARLQQFTGSWSVKMSARPQADAPFEESVVGSESRLILGGRFLQEQVQGDMGGMAYEGILVTGYDNVAGSYNFFWIDNFATLMITGTGDWDAKSNSLTVRSEFTDPSNGKRVLMRLVRRVQSSDRFVVEMFMSRPGEPEFKSMNLEYSRTGPATR